MKTIQLGTSAIQVSQIGLGCMRMAGKSVEGAEKVVLTALDSGISFFDHADIYGGGESERIFGEVLRRNPSIRAQITVQDKCGICKGCYDASKEHILEAVEGSLKRLGLEQIDVLLLHRPDALMEPEEVAEAYRRLEADGKVRQFGVSNQNAAQMALLQKYMPMKIVADQLQFGPAHTGMVDTGINVNMDTPFAAMKDGCVLDYCRLNDITVQAWSPMQYGMIEGSFFTNPDFAELNAKLDEVAAAHGVSRAAVTIAWILRHPAKIQALVGTMNPDHVRDIAAAYDVNLSRREWYEIYLAGGNPLP